MATAFTFNKQNCGFRANLKMKVTAAEAKTFSVEYAVEVDATTRQAINEGIEKAMIESGMSPQVFTVVELVEFWEDTPYLGFECCARGAARLALGISEQGTA